MVDVRRVGDRVMTVCSSLRQYAEVDLCVCSTMWMKDSTIMMS